MKREDLFLAIGEVEESRLARSELCLQEPSGAEPKEAPVMKKKRVSVGRILRNVVAAALILSMVSVTAYAVGAYVIYDSPEELITAIFGDETGYDHQEKTTATSPLQPGSSWEVPGFDRVPVDETVVAEDIAPHVSAVGQSISWEGYTLTVDAHMYDSETKCGLLTYTLENPDGFPEYRLQANGELWFPGGEIVGFGQYGYSYIIQEKTTDTKLAATYYYRLNEEWGEDLYITFAQGIALSAEEESKILEQLIQEVKQEKSREEILEEMEQNPERYEALLTSMSEDEVVESVYVSLAQERLQEQYSCPEKIVVECKADSMLDNVTLGNGSVVISPISFRIDVQNLEFLHTNIGEEKRIHAENVHSVVIRFRDGTEYAVSNDDVDNTLFSVVELSEGARKVEKFVSPEEDPEGEGYYYVDIEDGYYSVLTMMFNRILDVDQVESVLVNGTELTLD